MQSRWPRPLFYLMILLVVVVDQLSKAWATVSLRPVHRVDLIPGFFSLTYVQNEGIAFGMFQGQGLLIALFMVVLAVLAVFYARSLNWATREPNIVGGALCGGAAGNLLDRCRLGYVVDFFDAHAAGYYWPVFNVADSAICLAVGWIVVRQLMGAPGKAPTT